MASTATSSSSSSDSDQPHASKRELDESEDEDSTASSSNDSDDTDAEHAEEEDVPVLSHAELRRQKKKELKKAAASDNSKTSDSIPAKSKTKVKNTAELAPSKVPKRQNSVWVGNLSFKTTPDALRQFFDGVGEITRVHMPMKMASAGSGARGAVKENRGFAYVDFASPDAKTVAITLSENHLDGRRLLIKDGGDFTGRPSTSSAVEGATAADGDRNLTGHTKTAQKILRSQKQPAGPTLFLGNLGFEATEQSIRGLFESHRVKKVDSADGADMDVDQPPPPEKKWIRKIRMGTFEDSGKCKGWAFVDFLTTDDATTALTNPKNHFLDGRKLVVEYASPEAVRRGGAGPRGDKDKGKAKTAPAGDDQDDASADKPRRERVRPARKRDVEDGEEKPAKRRKGEDGDQVVQHSVAAPRGRDSREKGRDGRPMKVRAKPGAALANAKRETASIVPSQGKKIVF